MEGVSGVQHVSLSNTALTGVLVRYGTDTWLLQLIHFLKLLPVDMSVFVLVVQLINHLFFSDTITKYDHRI